MSAQVEITEVVRGDKIRIAVELIEMIKGYPNQTSELATVVAIYRDVDDGTIVLHLGREA